jgi:hypothetical protein
MNRKAYNVWFSSVVIEMKNSPCHLWWADITAVDVRLYFVSVDLESRAVAAFMDVFERILDRFHRRSALDVDVAVVFG